MSDDLVTRLRQEWEYGNLAKGCDYEMFAQAADEIERLRKALALAVHKLILYAPYRDKSPENLFEFFKEAASHD